MKKNNTKAQKSPKEKLAALKQTNGKVENPITLNQLWGDTGTDKYNTMDAKEYEGQLSEMNLADLQVHAVNVGFAPGDNRRQLVGKLVNEFNKHVNAYKMPVSQEDVVGQDKEALRILSEGR